MTFEARRRDRPSEGTSYVVELGLEYAFGAAFTAETFTTTPLGAGATYTGPAKDWLVCRLGFMGAIAFSDQASATNGFKIQQSVDGTNWDLDTAVTSTTASTGAGLKAAIVGRYARVSFTNGATAQTVFRLGGRYMIA